MNGENATGSSRPDYRISRGRVSEDEWKELLAERKGPAAGQGVPIGIMRRPLQLPPMRKIQRGEVPE